MNKIIILWSVLLFAVPAYATNWVEVASGTYIDIDSIKRNVSQGELITIYWVKDLNRRAKIEELLNKKTSKVIHKEVTYCGRRINIILESYVYDEQDSLIRSYTFYDVGTLNHRSIVPDSVGEAIYDFVCK